MSPVVSATRRGAIATPHHLATEAGADAYRRGGTAIDAALAAAAVLTVVYPHNTGIGGDSVSLVRRPGAGTVCVNSTGYAPAAASLDELRARYGGRLPVRGVDAVTVPGMVRGWEAVSGLGGRLPWSELIAPAIPLAETSPVSRSLADAIALGRDHLAQDPGCAAVFFDDAGRPLTEGAPLVQRRLADSLRAIRRGGADELYTGELGSRLAAGLRRLGSRIDGADLAEFRPEIVEPLTGEHRDVTVLTSPPNTQGFLLLRLLLEVEELGEDADVLGADAGRLAELFERGSRVREAMLCDPAFQDVDMERLLRGPVDLPPGPGLGAGPGGVPRGDTVGIAAVDSDGFAVSHIQSHFFHFGASLLEPETGILLHNRGTSFSLDPASPNRIEPRKRPSHTLMPVMVEREGELAWVNACMGGKGQAQVHAHLLLRQLASKDSGQTVGEPRFVVGSYGPDEPEDLLHIETGIPAAAEASLKEVALPHVVEPRHSEKFGQANVIAIDAAGGFDAASDPRSDGSALVVDLPSPGMRP